MTATYEQIHRPIPGSSKETSAPESAALDSQRSTKALVCLVVYLVPPTSVLGAVLWTGYLVGAVATHVRVGDPLFSHILFPSTSPPSSGLASGCAMSAFAPFFRSAPRNPRAHLTAAD